ncbi:MAG: hypothetical protein MR416_01710 [Lachnospiraceae bacterium]|nr:hypothetical protein [Lachnospiraceae bacterium]
MKKYCIAFLIYAAVLCMAYYGSYRLSYGYYRGHPDAQEETSDAGETVRTDASKAAILRSDTEYITENYNRKTGAKEEVKSQMPTALLGMNREEAASYAGEYSLDPGIEELEKGFEYMELISFSPERVVFRKTYMPWDRDYKYMLCETDGCVTVCYLDGKTVYEYTDILCRDLPADLRSRIVNGTCRMDVHELYDFLENYSS